ncbi:hypothetical protein GCM10010103_40490 [Streptomyces paradoxus]|uniref:Uncharacterized protein n=1 Tax=Streptomyces paradoxus TaxID=66375 RepID=A0A7W9TBL9_9ACTN|nr:hypothetical protein [Streptomyces paradoxus]MBB6077695.1 hypothetical protein [Streptomyces paradoxus]
MKLVQLLSALFGLISERMIETRYGTSGMLCLFLLGVGLRTRNPTCLTIAAVLMGLLLARY